MQFIFFYFNVHKLRQYKMVTFGLRLPTQRTHYHYCCYILKISFDKFFAFKCWNSKFELFKLAFFTDLVMLIFVRKMAKNAQKFKLLQFAAKLKIHTKTWLFSNNTSDLVYCQINNVNRLNGWWFGVNCKLQIATICVWYSLFRVTQSKLTSLTQTPYLWSFVCKWMHIATFLAQQQKVII